MTYVALTIYKPALENVDQSHFGRGRIRMKLILTKLILFALCIYYASATYYNRVCYTKRISNGQFWPTRVEVPSGRAIKIACNDGYYLSGSRYLECRYGRWNVPFPTCKKHGDDNDDDDDDNNSCEWTRYFDRDNSGYTGDHENLRDLRRVYPGQICSNPVKFEARTVVDHIPYQRTGEKVTASLTHGFTCINEHQRDSKCSDYEIRFCCPPKQTTACKWTRYFDRDDSDYTGDHENLWDLRRVYPGQICSNPTDFEVRTVDKHIPYQRTGEDVTASLTHGFTCINRFQRDKICSDYEIRFCCPTSSQEQGCRPYRVYNSYVRNFRGWYAHGQSITYTCRDGYKLTGSATLKCDDGKWDHKAPECVRSQDNTNQGCRPYRVYNSYVRNYLRWYPHGQSITYICKDGYKIDGAATLTCHDGKWNDDAPECVRKQDDRSRCRGPGDFDLGSYHPVKDYYYPGETVWFKCDEPYNLEGKKDVKCQTDGTWSADFPTCEKDDESCPELNQPNNGDFSPRQDVYLVDDTVTFTCADGFALKGAEVIECRDGGAWTAEEPICIKRECRAPEEFPYGTYEPIKDDYVTDDSLWFNCNDGFELQGQKDVICNADGTWSHDFPTCEKLPVCGPPDGPGNGGGYEPVQDEYILGDAVAYHCDKGYKLIGAELLLCLEDGWSFDEPICKRKANGCPQPGVPENGRVHFGNDGDDDDSDDDKIFPVGRKVWYKCNSGFTIQGIKDVICREGGNWSAPAATCKRNH